MTKPTINRAQKGISPIPCPGCGDPMPCETWHKDLTTFQSLDCHKCGVTWGRILGKSGTWHVVERITK